MSFVQRPGFEYMDLDDFEEYLADKPAHEKWELIGGRVVKLMVGARFSHHRLVRNLSFAFETRFRAKKSNCDVFTETFWLKERFMDLAVFPDLMIRCGAPLDLDAISLNDPLVLAEVVSPGSQGRDRSEKAELYKRLPSLKHCLMLDRDRAVIDVIDRIDERSWTSRRVEGRDAAIELTALGLSIPLSELYEED
jgi:Uma2 family endonuclease